MMNGTAVDFKVAKLMPTAFGGHCLYVRRCHSGKTEDPDGYGKVGGIFVVGQRADRSRGWAEVLGIGPRVGEPVQDIKRHNAKHLLKRPVQLEPQCRVGDLVLMPGPAINAMDMRGVEESPISPNEFFVEESVPIAVEEKDEEVAA